MDQEGKLESQDASGGGEEAGRRSRIPDDRDLSGVAGRLGKELARRGLTLCVAESCTGGWVCKALTDVAGSSLWFDRGFVAYSEGSLREMLGVSGETMAESGAVSEECAREMAFGALERSSAWGSVAVTGLAGPGGDGSGKMVGTVCVSWTAVGTGVFSETAVFSGGREDVRRQAVGRALNGLLDLLAEWRRPAPSGTLKAKAGL